MKYFRHLGIALSLLLLVLAARADPTRVYATGDNEANIVITPSSIYPSTDRDPELMIARASSRQSFALDSPDLADSGYKIRLCNLHCLAAPRDRFQCHRLCNDAPLDSPLISERLTMLATHSETQCGRYCAECDTEIGICRIVCQTELQSELSTYVCGNPSEDGEDGGFRRRRRGKRGSRRAGAW